MADQAVRRLLLQLQNVQRLQSHRFLLQNDVAAVLRGQCSQPLFAASHRGFAAAGSTAAGVRQRSLFRRVKACVRDFKQLSKFRLSALVALTASAGFAAGSETSVDYEKLLWTSVGTFGAAACANTLNQLYEIHNDSRMARTCNRPLPAGRMARGTAAAFAVLSGAAGLLLLSEKTNSLTTALGAANIVLYAGIYTPMKQITIFNTWVGAVVGAIPPLMGWAAAAGQLDPGAWVLSAALFSWQMPHFLALAWMCQDDYRRGGFKMLPSVDPTGRRTAAVALRHCAFLLPLGAAAVALQITSPWFAGEAAVLAAAMGVGTLAFRANPTAAGARRLFKGSLLYLPLLLAAVAVHRQPKRHNVSWEGLHNRVGATVQDARVAGLPDQLQPGHIWQQLQQLQLPDVRMRPLEERYAILFEFRRQVQALKCPSRVYGDSKDCPLGQGTTGDAAGSASPEASASLSLANADGADGASAGR